MKFLLKLFVFLLLVAVLAGVAGYFFVDRIAEAAVERESSRALGVPTELAGLDVEPFRGTLELKGLTVANPDGFQSPRFLELAGGRASVELRSLLQQVMVIPRLELTGIEVVLEQSGARSNARAILENLRKARPEAEPGAKEPAEGKRYILREVEIRDVLVRAEATALGNRLQGVEVRIPSIRMEDIGTERGGGAQLADVCAALVRAILDAAAKEGAGRLPPDLLEGVERGLEGIREKIPGKLPQGIPENPREVPREIPEGLRDIFKRPDASSPAPREREDPDSRR